MDLATPVGILGAFGVIITANILEGGNPAHMLLLPPMLLVFGGTIMISIAGGTMADAKAIPKSLIKALTGKAATASDVVPVVVSLADRARREGLLSLEDSIKTIDDPFLVKGVTMAVDGTDHDEIRDILEGEVMAARSAAKQSAKFFADSGAYAPTVGIIGTVMGLVHVLENLAEPEKLGHMIAAAFLATLWGVTSANAMFLPIGSRLKRLGDLEAARMEIVIEGVLAIASGSNPRIIAQKLSSLLPADQRPEAEAA